MRVTIGLPFYNAEKTLEDAIRSIFAQSFQGWELILIDDGSTDRSLDIARAISDPRVTVVSDGVNRSLPYRLNQVTKMAKGEYIVRMDADDIMHPERLALQVEYLDANPAVDVVFTSVFTIDKDSTPVGMRSLAELSLKPRDVLQYGLAIHPTMTGRAEWFHRNPYNDRYLRAEDHELWCRTFQNTVFAKIGEPLLFYRECSTVNLKNYLLSCKTDRKIIAEYGPSMVGRTVSARLIINSHLKGLLYRFFTILGKQGHLVRMRNQPLDITRKEIALQVIKYIRDVNVSGLQPTNPSKGLLSSHDARQNEWRADSVKRMLMLTTVSSTLRAFLIPFAVHFRGLGWRVDGMANSISNCSDCRKNLDQVWEIGWSRNPLDFKNIINSIRSIRIIVERNHYDIVHAHTPIAAFVTRFALRKLRARSKLKVVYTAHGFHFNRNGSILKNMIFLNLEKLAGHWTDALVVINKEDREAVLKYRIVPASRLYYMPGIGVDTLHYCTDQVSMVDETNIRRELSVNKQQPLFLMIADFVSGKRHKDALRAFERISNSEAHLVLAGSGPLYEEQRALAQELGIAERVHFVGQRNDIPVLIKVALATLLPSQREGLPRCIMESMSMGVPVIGTNIRGIRDLLDDDCGLLVSVGDINGLSQAMEWMLEHRYQARKMGLRGREKMRAVFDTRLIVKLHENLYADVLEEQDYAVANSRAS